MSPVVGPAAGPAGEALTGALVAPLAGAVVDRALGPGIATGSGTGGAGRGDEVLVVRGGAGGLVADGLAMAGAAQVLHRSALVLGEVGADVVALVARATLTAAPVVDPAGAGAVAQTLAVAVGPGGTGGTAAACGVLAAQLAVAGAAYEEAEGLVDRSLARLRGGAAAAAGSALGAAARRPEVWGAGGSAVLVAASGAALVWVAVRGGGLVGEVGDAAAGALADGRLDPGERAALSASAAALPGDLEVLAREDAAAAGGALAAEASRLAAQHPRALQHLVAALPPLLAAAARGGGGGPQPSAAARALPHGDRWAWPPRDVADLAAGVAVLAAQDGALRPTRVEVRAVGPARSVTPARGTADLLARARPMAGGGALSPAGRATSAAPIAVERVVDGAGARRWVVVLPPTQTTAAPWDEATTNPADLGTDLRGVGELPTAMTRAAVEAMDRAGVAPDEPVLLVGYSQGGITAAQLAADPALRSRFAVDAVLTAGAPVAGLDVPPDVAVLSLEHEEDWIASLEGADAPATPSRTTVLRDLPDAATAPAPGEPADGTAGHDLGRYRETAALVDASDDPSLVAWRARVAPYLAGEGTTSSARLFLAERRPPGAG
ncbi:hypothetical protein [uncultured Pseudokineococcus sp.]|uniref:hypothetical protein n=1 Tax=uncultured Pseudokineococcus sp. TaxID=1642928 RepID=UPI0026301989|nr:hypothetical protein [uncultured Pseudokineococcus sp.]